LSTRPIITASDIPSSGTLRVANGSIVTPSARELAALRGVAIQEVAPSEVTQLAPPERTVAIGSDHGGFAMKQALLPVFAELGLTVRDVGVYEEKPADYPDIALAVATLVHEGTATRGVVVDGAGIGSCMAANKVQGVRAALCYDVASARNSREHNDANVLTLGGRLLTFTQAENVLRTWLATAFGGGRHAARVEKIMAIEHRFRRAATE
jgi:ribose 5-phosphate isomerase B